VTGVQTCALPIYEASLNRRLERPLAVVDELHERGFGALVEAAEPPCEMARELAERLREIVDLGRHRREGGVCRELVAEQIAEPRAELGLERVDRRARGQIREARRRHRHRFSDAVD